MHSEGMAQIENSDFRHKFRRESVERASISKYLTGKTVPRKACGGFYCGGGFYCEGASRPGLPAFFGVIFKVFFHG